MMVILIICWRELRAYLTTLSGSIILAAHLLLSGLLFNAYAMGSRAKLSQRVIEDFFYMASGMAMITAILLSIRLIAEERQTQTFVLLRTAPVSERQIVIGKYLSALAFFTITLAASVYLPMLVFVHGKVSLGQIFAGYLGLLLLGSACIAISLLASSWCNTQILAGALAALDPALAVDPGSALFRIGGAGQDDVGAVRAAVAVMALIDHEGLAEPAGVDLVGGQQVDGRDLALFRAVQDAGDVAAAVARHEAQIQPADAGRRRMQDVEAVPVLARGAGFFRDPAGRRQHRRAVLTRQRAHADDNHRPFGLLQNLRE